MRQLAIPFDWNIFIVTNSFHQFATPMIWSVIEIWITFGISQRENDTLLPLICITQSLTVWTNIMLYFINLMPFNVVSGVPYTQHDSLSCIKHIFATKFHSDEMHQCLYAPACDINIKYNFSHSKLLSIYSIDPRLNGDAITFISIELHRLFRFRKMCHLNLSLTSPCKTMFVMAENAFFCSLSLSLFVGFAFEKETFCKWIKNSWKSRSWRICVLYRKFNFPNKSQLIAITLLPILLLENANFYGIFPSDFFLKIKTFFLLKFTVVYVTLT